MSALFIHCNFRLTSWYAPSITDAPRPLMLTSRRDYFWATLGLYGTAWLVQVVRTLYVSTAGLTCSIEQLSESNMIKVVVSAPERFKWKPGQHVFLRFLTVPGLHSLSTHPFTVANVPTDVKSSGKRDVEIVFRVRGGITKVLQSMATTNPRSRVLLDGPYGGIPVSLRGFDRVYLLAGGSGT